MKITKKQPLRPRGRSEDKRQSTKNVIRDAYINGPQKEVQIIPAKRDMEAETEKKKLRVCAYCRVSTDEDTQATWEWLKGVGCAAKVSPQLLERYAMCSARWVQCEEMTNRMGFLSKHPTTGKPIPSPFINIGINYMNQAVRLWNEIFQIVKENCSTEYGEATPQDDLMERLLRARKPFL